MDDPPSTKDFVTKLSLPKFVSLMKRLTPKQKDLVCSMGFEHLLHLCCEYLPHGLIKYLVKRFHPQSRTLSLPDGSSIVLSPRCVNKVLGTPVGGKLIGEKVDPVLRNYIAQLTNCEGNYPTINELDKLITPELEGDVFKVVFTMYAITAFLCPSSHDAVSPYYLHIVSNPKEISSFNFSLAILDKLVSSIGAYNEGSTCVLGGNLVLLMVIYFEFLDCDVIPTPSKSLLPRLSVWSSTLVHSIESMDCISSNLSMYGRLPIKHVSATPFGFMCNQVQVRAKKSFDQLMNLILSLCPEEKHGLVKEHMPLIMANMYKEIMDSIEPIVMDNMVNVLSLIAGKECALQSSDMSFAKSENSQFKAPGVTHIVEYSSGGQCKSVLDEQDMMNPPASDTQLPEKPLILKDSSSDSPSTVGLKDVALKDSNSDSPSTVALKDVAGNDEMDKDHDNGGETECAVVSLVLKEGQTQYLSGDQFKFVPAAADMINEPTSDTQLPQKPLILKDSSSDSPCRVALKDIARNEKLDEDHGNEGRTEITETEVRTESTVVSLVIKEGRTEHSSVGQCNSVLAEPDKINAAASDSQLPQKPVILKDSSSDSPSTVALKDVAGNDEMEEDQDNEVQTGRNETEGRNESTVVSLVMKEGRTESELSTFVDNKLFIAFDKLSFSQELNRSCSISKAPASLCSKLNWNSNKRSGNISKNDIAEECIALKKRAKMFQISKDVSTNSENSAGHENHSPMPSPKLDESPSGRTDDSNELAIATAPLLYCHDEIEQSSKLNGGDKMISTQTPANQHAEWDDESFDRELLISTLKAEAEYTNRMNSQFTTQVNTNKNVHEIRNSNVLRNKYQSIEQENEDYVNITKISPSIVVSSFSSTLVEKDVFDDIIARVPKTKKAKTKNIVRFGSTWAEHRVFALSMMVYGNINPYVMNLLGKAVMVEDAEKEKLNLLPQGHWMRFYYDMKVAGLFMKPCENPQTLSKYLCHEMIGIKLDSRDLVHLPLFTWGFYFLLVVNFKEKVFEVLYPNTKDHLLTDHANLAIHNFKMAFKIAYRHSEVKVDNMKISFRSVCSSEKDSDSGVYIMELIRHQIGGKILCFQPNHAKPLRESLTYYMVTHPCNELMPPETKIILKKHNIPYDYKCTPGYYPWMHEQEQAESSSNQDDERMDLMN